MITDIPSPLDFDIAGRGFLNLAFDTVLVLYSTLCEAGFANRNEDEDDQRIREEFWSKAQPSLQIAAILVGQATEFLLKGRIAEVSPLLLLEPRAFQTGAKPVRFAELRTINAEDLVPVHDAVRHQPLDPSFAAFVSTLRTRRTRSSTRWMVVVESSRVTSWWRSSESSPTWWVSTDGSECAGTIKPRRRSRPHNRPTLWITK